MNNICFECGNRPGLECPGRKEGEHTRCQICFNHFMIKENVRNAQHILKLLYDILESHRGKDTCIQKCKEIIDSCKNTNTDYLFHDFLQKLVK
jgi:hypothetical protein